MFFSKRGDLNARLTRQFQRKRIRKRYLAVCEGHLAERQTVDAPIARVGAITFAVRDRLSVSRGVRWGADVRD